MTDSSSLDVVRAPLGPLDLSGTYEFQQMQMRGVSLAVDSEASARIAAAAELAKLGTPSAVPYLVEMMSQDRITGATGDLVGAFTTGTATTVDARRAENIAAFGEADLACQVAASDALATMGPAALPALAEALKSPIANKRSGAARALGEIGAPSESALAVLKHLARADPSETVRKAAEDAVKKIRPRRWFSF